jgi:hypothetical protein
MLPQGWFIQASADKNDRVSYKFSGAGGIPRFLPSKSLRVLVGRESYVVGGVVQCAVKVHYFNGISWNCSGRSALCGRNNVGLSRQAVLPHGCQFDVIDIQRIDSVPGEGKPDGVFWADAVSVYGETGLKEVG